MAARKVPITPPRGFDFTRSEAADYLGVTESTLAAWATRKTHLPFVRSGNRTWYRRSDLDALLRRRTVKVA